MPHKLNEKKLLLSILLFALALAMAVYVIINQPLHSSGANLFLLIFAFVIGRVAILVFNLSRHKVKER